MIDIIILIELTSILLAGLLILAKLPFALYSPVYTLIGFYLINGFAGLYLYGFTDWTHGTFYDVGLSTQALLETMSSLLFLVLSFSLGVLLHLYFPRYRHINPMFFHQQRFIFLQKKSKDRMTSLLMLIAIIPLILLILGNGIQEIFVRDVYLAEPNRMIKIMGSAFAPFSLIVLGFLTIKSGSVGRITGILLFLLYEVIFFALSTRLLALGPILFMTGALLAAPHSKKIRILFLLSIVVSILFLIRFPLLLRRLPEQGLLPNAEYFLTHLEFFFSNTVVSVWEAIFNMTYFLPLTGHIIQTESLDPSYLWVSLNPLPGFMTHWYEIKDNLRINVYIPYNAPGQLLNHGFLIASSYFFILGSYYSHLDKKIRLRFGQGKILSATIILGMALLLILMSSQYNLRTITRLIYYLLAFEVVLVVLPWVWRIFQFQKVSTHVSH